MAENTSVNTTETSSQVSLPNRQYGCYGHKLKELSHQEWKEYWRIKPGDFKW